MVGGVALVLAWLVGRVVSDRFLWSQFLFWIPTPIAALAALIGTLALAARRNQDGATTRPRIAAAGLFATGLAIAAFSLGREHRVWARSAPTDGALRLLHCNIHWPDREHAPDVMAYLATRDDDLIVLTEPGWLLLDERGSQLALAGWTVLRTGRFAVLSRLPIIEARPLVRAEQSDLTLLRVDASARGLGDLRICLADLPSDPRRPRMASAERLRALLDGDSADASSRSDPLETFDMVLGDLNNTPRAASLDRLFPGMRDAQRDAGRGIGGSWPAWLPLWQLDHVLLGPRLRAVDYILVDTGLSAHRAQEVALVPTPS